MGHEPRRRVESNGTAFSYLDVDSENGGNKVNLNQSILVNGEKPIDDVNGKIGLLVFKTDDSQIPMKNSNELGLEIFNLPNCDKLEANIIKSKSSGH